MVLFCIVGGCAREASHQGSTLSDLRLATGFGPFNLPTCGPRPKGRDHSHVESGKNIYMSVLFIVVAVCLLLSYFVYHCQTISVLLMFYKLVNYSCTHSLPCCKTSAVLLDVNLQCCCWCCFTAVFQVCKSRVDSTCSFLMIYRLV